MSRPLWFVALLKKSFPQRFRLARLTHLPVIGALTDRSLNVAAAGVVWRFARTKPST